MFIRTKVAKNNSKLMMLSQAAILCPYHIKSLGIYFDYPKKNQFKEFVNNMLKITFRAMHCCYNAKYIVKKHNCFKKIYTNLLTYMFTNKKNNVMLDKD